MKILSIVILFNLIVFSELRRIGGMLPPNLTTTTTYITTYPPSTGFPNHGTWEVFNATSNSSCILLETGGEILIYRLDKRLTIPANAHVTGACGDAQQSIALSWIDFEPSINVELTFSRDAEVYALTYINVTIKYEEETLKYYHTGSAFITPLGMSVECGMDWVFPLYDESTVVGEIEMFSTHLEAFGNIFNRGFSMAMNCEPYETSFVARIIIIWCIFIVVMVIVTIIAYLIGRHQNPPPGYFSMFGSQHGENVRKEWNGKKGIISESSERIFAERD